MNAALNFGTTAAPARIRHRILRCAAPALLCMYETSIYYGKTLKIDWQKTGAGCASSLRIRAVAAGI